MADEGTSPLLALLSQAAQELCILVSLPPRDLGLQACGARPSRVVIAGWGTLSLGGPERLLAFQGATSTMGTEVK